MGYHDYDITPLAFTIIFLIAVLFLIVGLWLTPYAEFESIETKTEIISEEFITLKVQSATYLNQDNVTEVNYIKGYGFFGNAESETIRIATNQTIFPDDKLLVKKKIINTYCDIFEIKDGEKIFLHNTEIYPKNSTMNMFHGFGAKSDWTGDDCGRKLINTIQEEAVTNG